MRHPIEDYTHINHSDKLRIATLIFLALLFKTPANAQINMPKIIGIVMIGKSNKPILDIYIVDSTVKNEFKFDIHTIVLYTDKSILNNIFSPFQNEKKYDSLTKFDKSFGTFLFYFQFQNLEKVEVVANRIHSAVLFQKILCTLSPYNKNEALIIKEINETLSRIM